VAVSTQQSLIPPEAAALVGTEQARASMIARP
jgi:hypothetical protein